MLEVHEGVIMHAAGRAIRFPLPEPYVTFDYREFCHNMLCRTDADVQITRATGRTRFGIRTTTGEITGRFVVHASGWRAFQGDMPGFADRLDQAGRGIEMELPVQVDIEPGLHFYFERRIVNHGYAWLFPCDDRVRIGLVSSREKMVLRRRLKDFVSEFGLDVGTTHGGVMPVVRRSPIIGDDLVVGDAAGQCLPITDEGIRTTIVHGIVSGSYLARALEGRISATEARRQYRKFVERTNRYHHNLERFMTFVDHAPETVIAWFGSFATATPLGRFALNHYLSASGWPVAARTGRRFPVRHDLRSEST